MIERVRIEPLLYRIRPLFVGNWNVSNRASDGSPEGVDHVFYCWGLANQGIHALRRHASIRQQSCCDPGYVFRTHEWNDRFILAPRQEGGALLGDAVADKSPHIFVIGWRLEVNSVHLRPFEDAIGQSMLQIAEAGSMLQIAKAGLAGPALKLRIVYHQLDARIACGCREDCDRLKQPVGNGIRKVCALHFPHRGLSGSWVQEITLDHFGTL